MTAKPAPIVRFSVVESTQRTAFELAAEGAVDRTVVVADHQSAGRGRRGRAWADVPGTSLLTSILIRPQVTPTLLGTFSIATGVAVAEALRRATGIEGRLKWPNDVLVRERKVAGILVESRRSEEPLLVIGVGLNLAQQAFPGELADRATSVAIETGRAPDRDAMLATLLEEFDAWRWRLESQGFGQVRERWLARSDTIGRTVTVDAVTGIAVGLDVDGALLVDDGRGVQRIVAGEIAPEVSHAPRR
jgi:BirA family biotin operon repressor/biotin-[acetyl-CoA-carboxylase] ligase